jgi:uncharacterized protein YutD
VFKEVKNMKLNENLLWYTKVMKQIKCFFCEKDATHYDVVVDHADYIVADVCFNHLSMGLVS